MSNRAVVNPRSLRGGSLLAAPFWLAAVILAAFSLWSVLWLVNTSSTKATSWLWVFLPLVGAALCCVAAMGCRVRLLEGKVEDLVAWRRVAAYAAGEMERIEVRRGVWRFFVVITPDATRPLLGLGPSQFPSTLLPESSERDQATIATLRGYQPPGGIQP